MSAWRQPSRRPVCRERSARLIDQRQRARMTTFLFLFLHGGGWCGCASPAGGGSSLRGQRYTPPAAQRLRAVHPAGGDGSRCARLDRPGTDGGAVSAERGSMALSRHLPTCRLIAHHKTRRRETVQQAVHEKNQGQRHHQRDRHRGDAVQIAEHQILIRM